MRQLLNYKKLKLLIWLIFWTIGSATIQNYFQITGKVGWCIVYSVFCGLMGAIVMYIHIRGNNE